MVDAGLGKRIPGREQNIGHETRSLMCLRTSKKSNVAGESVPNRKGWKGRQRPDHEKLCKQGCYLCPTHSPIRMLKFNHQCYGIQR